MAEDINDHLLIHFVHFVKKELPNVFVSHTNHSYIIKLTSQIKFIPFLRLFYLKSKTFPSTSQPPTSVTHPRHQRLRRELCRSHRKRKAYTRCLESSLSMWHLQVIYREPERIECRHYSHPPLLQECRQDLKTGKSPAEESLLQQCGAQGGLLGSIHIYCCYRNSFSAA